jgi:hypothetical protein
METVSIDSIHRAIIGFTIVPYQLPDGCCGAYYPEANPLMPLYLHDAQSGTPSGKAIPVRIFKAESARGNQA